MPRNGAWNSGTTRLTVITRIDTYYHFNEYLEIFSEYCRTRVTLKIIQFKYLMLSILIR